MMIGGKFLKRNSISVSDLISTVRTNWRLDIQQKQSLSFGYIYSIRETAEELEKRTQQIRLLLFAQLLADLVKISTDAEIDLLQCMHRGTKVVQALHKALDRKKRAENAEFMMDEQDAKPQKKSKYKFPRRAVLADFDPASTDGTQNLAIAEASEFQSRWAQLKAENGLWTSDFVVRMFQVQSGSK